MAKVLCADSGTTLGVGSLLLHRDALLKEGSLGSKQQNTLLHSLSSRVLHTTHTNVSHLHFTKSLSAVTIPFLQMRKGVPEKLELVCPQALGHGKYFGVERKEDPHVSIMFTQHAHRVSTLRLLLSWSCGEFMLCR